jgi:hypothetical protein
MREHFGPELHIITPTPPMQAVGQASEEGTPEAGPSKPRHLSSPPPPEADGHDLPAEHAWDSVVSAGVVGDKADSSGPPQAARIGIRMPTSVLTFPLHLCHRSSRPLSPPL